MPADTPDPGGLGGAAWAAIGAAAVAVVGGVSKLVDLVLSRKREARADDRADELADDDRAWKRVNEVMARQAADIADLRARQAATEADLGRERQVRYAMQARVEVLENVIRAKGFDVPAPSSGSAYHAALSAGQEQRGAP